MKTKLLILSFLLITGMVWGQSLINESRMLNNPINLREATTDSMTTPNNQDIDINSKFTIVGEEGEYYKIYFWNWDKDKEQNKYNKLNYNTSKGEQRYFLIKKHTIDVLSTKIYNRFSPAWGTFVYPFKWRLKDSQFEPTFSMSLAGGVKWNPWYTNRHVFSLLVGVGPSSVSLTKYNATKNNIPIEDNISAAAVTFSLNLMYQYEFVQFGLSYGVDNIFDSNLYSWNNQGKPWLSFGVGISVFKDNDRTATPTNN